MRRTLLVSGMVMDGTLERRPSKESQKLGGLVRDNCKWFHEDRTSFVSVGYAGPMGRALSLAIASLKHARKPGLSQEKLLHQILTINNELMTAGSLYVQLAELIQDRHEFKLEEVPEAQRLDIELLLNSFPARHNIV